MAPKKAEKTKADKAEKAAKAVKTNVAKKAGATGFHQWVLSWNRSCIMCFGDYFHCFRTPPCGDGIAAGFTWRNM